MQAKPSSEHGKWAEPDESPDESDPDSRCWKVREVATVLRLLWVHAETDERLEPRGDKECRNVDTTQHTLPQNMG